MQQILQNLIEDHKYMIKMLYQLNQQVMSYSGMHQNSFNMDHLLEIVDYLKNYPDLCHRPVEERMYHLIREKITGMSEYVLLEKVIDEHQMLDALAELLDIKIGEVVSGKADKSSLLRTCNMFVRQQLKHIECEQTHIFPLCEKFFTDAEWFILEATALAVIDQNSDMDEYQALREKIALSNMVTSG